MRLLLVAPTADRDAVGESWIAYQWISRLAERHSVTVLSYYQRSGRPLAPQVPNAQVVEWREPPLLGRHERFNAMVNPGFIPFYRRARNWILNAKKGGVKFDIAHQIVPVSLRYASPLVFGDSPYILGPVGGSLRSPAAFVSEEGRAPWFTSLRAIDAIRLRHDPKLRRSYERAACVIGIADYVQDILQDVSIKRFQALNDTGIDTMPKPAEGSSRQKGVRFLFVGRVVRTKGVRDAVRAISQLPGDQAVLDVVGEGYDRKTCQELAQELGVASIVRFHGRVAHSRVLEFYSDADVFLFPSYREAGGIVVTEAMSFGLPVIVCDAGGPASTVDDTSGIRVPAKDPGQYPLELARAMQRLAMDPQLRSEMGKNARRRIRDIGLWEGRIAYIEELYRDIIGTSPRD